MRDGEVAKGRVDDEIKRPKKRVIGVWRFDLGVGFGE